MNPLKSIYAAWDRAGKPLLANPFRRRKVTIIYTSVHLHGNYAFTFKPGQKGRVLDAWADHFAAQLPDGMTAQAIASCRSNPCIEIIEVF